MRRENGKLMRQEETHIRRRPLLARLGSVSAAGMHFFTENDSGMGLREKHDKSRNGAEKIEDP